MVDESIRKTLSNIPLLKSNAGPRDSETWSQRLKEEYLSLIKYVDNNKKADNDWFRLQSNEQVTYPTTAPEIALPELDGKTAKMYRGGKICLTDHFKPLWAKNVPKFGIGHAMALGLGPWLAVEIPELIEKGIVKYKNN
ncbi:PREDICTED: ubiquitin-fold modifier-conjugating enzyme 1 isoform X2 [Ceratosolen solmsi marchali]|uniref:Ubiquitin-fold modifier-conjugating enzyme 1 n=1 Tax=Ceratosolen solmsi marchali TaxID=326594 RepID=A0AAJ7DZW5_9HYME|nr:PREDICTED: ubiquitin-fold modifier-conjugating enzyme 1 isoform X2 [Ceratosolen solmsi marchali]